MENNKPKTGSKFPPLINKHFKEDGIKWSEIETVDFEFLGRLLTYHLLVEHHITRYLETKTNRKIDWDSARLSFSKKVTLALGAETHPKWQAIRDGISVINNLRNAIAHNIDAKLDQAKIKRLNAFLKSTNYKFAYESEIDTIESFCFYACGYLAGFCAVAEKEYQLKKVENN